MTKMEAIRFTGLVLAVALGATLNLACREHSPLTGLQRVQALLTDLRALNVGKSNFKEAQQVALKYDTVPYENHYGVRDCADGYFERCAYMIAVANNGTSAHRKVNDPWHATVLIFINKGIVEEYSFSAVYQTAVGKWRGFGAEMGMILPESRAVQAKISSSYSVQRNDIVIGNPRDTGFELQSSLTPNATPAERERAWKFNLSCLAEGKNCGEICEVMPDAWHDFYEKRGKFDVEKYGSAYLFCDKDRAALN
jgi:hypothetical protein